MSTVCGKSVSRKTAIFIQKRFGTIYPIYSQPLFNVSFTQLPGSSISREYLIGDEGVLIFSRPSTGGRIPTVSSVLMVWIQSLKLSERIIVILFMRTDSTNCLPYSATKSIKDKKLEVFDGHGTDLFTHWNIDDEGKMIDAYKKIDERIKDMHAECERRGISVMILSDHGHAEVNDTIDIAAKIKELGIQKHEISYLIEASKARFWFHTDSAKEKMLRYLSELDKGTLLHFEELYRYNIKFKDDSYGEYYFITNPGTIFFPTDFYHPLANLLFGLTNKNMRSRLKSSIYRSYHGHLPYNECEKGFVMLLDSGYKTNEKEIDIIDIAPTVLNLIGYDKPDSLQGDTPFYR